MVQLLVTWVTHEMWCLIQSYNKYIQTWIFLTPGQSASQCPWSWGFQLLWYANLRCKYPISNATFVSIVRYWDDFGIDLRRYIPTNNVRSRAHQSIHKTTRVSLRHLCSKWCSMPVSWRLILNLGYIEVTEDLQYSPNQKLKL